MQLNGLGAGRLKKVCLCSVDAVRCVEAIIGFKTLTILSILIL